jgi:hypothetical protein
LTGFTASMLATPNMDSYLEDLALEWQQYTAVSSILLDVIHDYALSKLPLYNQLGDAEAAVVNLVMSGASVYGLLLFTGTIDASNVLVPFEIGVASAVVGDYVYDNFVYDPHVILIFT